MTIGIGEDHELLAATAARWCDAAVDAGARRLGVDGAPPAAGDDARWAELVDLGWTGLHLPAEHGGAGGGLAELAVVLEALGRAGLPHPLLPAVLASAAIDRWGTDAGRAALLPRLAAGACATVAFASAPLSAGASGDGGLVVAPGTLGHVLAAGAAELVVAPVRAQGARRWVVLERGTFTAADDEASTDLGRSVGTVTLEAPVVVPAAHLVDAHPGDDPDGEGPAELAALLLSAEAVGIAQWCVDTAATHARDRVQFGRPIGQFQGVKHRCAEMLVRTERARAAVWDACRGGGADEARYAIACAAALAPAAAVDNAKDAIQVLGGIGFTWEHDAHLFLRRALATRALLPAASVWRARAVAAARAGTQRRLPVELPDEPAVDAYRAGVAAFADEVAAAPREDRHRLLADAGYLVPHWPEPYGRGASAVEQVVIDQELRRARVQRPHLQVAAWALPTLITHGTPEQQARWVGPSLRFDIRWCQLFSEPEAGSDLASLRMRAERVDGGWSLTGQKVWTSMAETADWGICLARTSPDKPNHEGITCFFVDMRTPGIDIRPLRELTGEAWFNEVFFDGVVVPDDCVIGAVDDGWRVGRTTLANERVSMGSGASLGAGVAALLALLDDTTPAVDVDRVGALLVVDHALAALRTRLTLRALVGADAGPEASVLKLAGVVHDQDVQELGVELHGPEAAAPAPGSPAAGWLRSFLWNRCLTIAGGTSEIQRNVIAERLLGLPKDP